VAGMVGSAPCCAVLATLALLEPPARPAESGGAEQPERIERAEQPERVEQAERAEPDDADDADDSTEVRVVETVEPEQPEPVVAAPVVATDDEIAPQGRSDDDDDDDDGPVERFSAGQWGMQFTFGGLAPMSIAGLRDVGANRLAFTELGFRRVVSDRLVIPFSIGAGLFRHSPGDEALERQSDVGVAASVGVQRYFRVWRRIAPFGGGTLRFSYSEPNGRANWRVGMGIGPVLGIEYFVGHRVSLTLQGNALVGFAVLNGLTQVELATQIDAGGQMGLTFYF